MSEIRLNVGPEVFRFTSLSNWVNKARGWFERTGLTSEDVIGVDAQGRVCTKGLHYMRAEKEGTYPIVVYLKHPEAAGPDPYETYWDGGNYVV